jgi:MFS family permease
MFSAPVAGGLLSNHLGWHSIFWFLCAAAVILLIPMFFFFPETSRNVVNDGSTPPPWWNRSVKQMVCRNRHWKTPEQHPTTPTSPKGPRLTNPLPTLWVILTDTQSLIILLIIGQSYCGIYALMTSIPSLMHSTYGYNSEQTGYLFLAWSAGTILSAFSTGAYLDWQYRREARRLNVDPNTDLQEIPHFPIEKVRLNLCIPILLVTGTTIVRRFQNPNPALNLDLNLTYQDNLRLAPRIRIPSRLRLRL